jgi:Beta-galactosidase
VGPEQTAKPGEKTMVRPMTVALLVLTLIAATRQAIADPATRAGFRDDGTLLVDGHPVFPIGVRSEKLDTIAPIADAGFNLVLGSGEWGQEHYQAAREAQLLVMGGHYVWLTFHGTKSHIDVRAREEALLRSIVSGARDFGGRLIHDALATFDAQPGVIGWCISDEPEAKLSEVAEAGYEIFKSNSPAHIVAQISCDPHWFKNWRNAADVLIVDHYPFRGSANTKSRQSVFQTYERIQRAVEDMDGKPVWLMPQLYPPSYWSCRPEEELTLRDMRLASYAGIIGGAKGILLYHWGVLPFAWTRNEDGNRVSVEVSRDVYDGRLRDIKALVGELKALSPMLVSGRSSRDLVVRWVSAGTDSPCPQPWRVWDYDGKRYLAIINLLDVPVEGDVYGINTSVNPRAYTADVFLGGEDVTVTPGAKDGEFTFRFAPRGAGVLVLERRPIPRKTEN